MKPKGSICTIACGLLAALMLVISCRGSANRSMVDTHRLTVISEEWGDSRGLDLASLRGRVAVLEFWGTYCAPCIVAIPHWNELVDKFDGKDVRFISVSDEDRATVERFLRRRSIKGTIALDSDRRLFKSYGVTAVPTTVILDREGQVLATTHPGSLTEEVLENILQGKEVDLPEKSMGDQVAMGPPPEEDKDESEPLFEIRIGPRAQVDFKGTTTGDTWWEGEGWSVRESIAFACNVDPKHVEIPDALAETYIDFRIRVPESMGDALHETLRDALAMTFSVNIERRTPQVDAYVMTLPQGRSPALMDTAASGNSSYLGTTLDDSMESGKIECVNQPMDRIARQFESMLGVPVLDETGVDNSFDFELEYANNTGSIIKAARERLGLEFKLTQRAMETVVVLPKPKLSAHARHD